MIGVTQKYKMVPRNLIMRHVSISGINPPVDRSMTTRSIKSFKEIPGPSSLPLIGPLHNFLPGGSLYNMNRTQLFSELLRKYGPIVRLDKLANQPDTVFLFDAESIGTVLRGEETSPRRTIIRTLEMYRQHTKKYHIGALFNGTDAEWKKFRSPANKVMMDPKVIQTSYSKIIDIIAKEVVARVKSIRNKNCMITNISDEMKLWAMETITAVTIGQRLDCFNRELAEDSHEKRFLSQIKTIFEYIETIEFEYNIFQKLNFRQNSNVLKTFSEVESLLLHFINKSRTSWESRKDKDIINDVHACTVEKIYYNNTDAALGVALDSMVGGVEGVTQTMKFLLYFLGSNYEKQQKLREEILSGRNQKQYLKACIKESSRILPTAFANTRVATKSHKVMGYEIPEKIVIVFPQHIISTMESHYPRATEFIPERWLVDKAHPLYYGNANPFTNIPFGYGVRTCLGRRLVEVIIEIFTVNIIKNFEVTWEGPPPKIALKAFNKIEEPNRFVFKDFQ